jgi:hypothetical protein
VHARTPEVEKEEMPALVGLDSCFLTQLAQLRMQTGQ